MSSCDAVITRPPLRWFGAKWRIAQWILSHLPPHVCYVEPFCGAAGVFLNKPLSEFEVINDIDVDLVNFFEVLRTRTTELVREIKLTPYSRSQFYAAWEPTDDPLEAARRLYIRSWQGWGGGKGGSAATCGWRFQRNNNRGKSVISDWNAVAHLIAVAERLKLAFIECGDALDCIRRYDEPTTLFYLDPPYLAGTRTERWRFRGYSHEIDEAYHVRLLEMLPGIQGMVVISGYPSALYEDRLGDWQREEIAARTTNPCRQATEVIWINPAAVEALARPRQMTLFGEVNNE